MFIDTDFLRSDEIFLKLEKTVEGNTDKDWLPTYHFDICDKFGTKMGGCDLRIGHNEKVYYGGNIGYYIDKEYRGHHRRSSSIARSKWYDIEWRIGEVHISI